MNESDRNRLQHMLDSSLEVIQFTRGRERASLDHDLMLARALLWSIGIIGEAASKISTELRQETPQIPWTKIVGMRNFVIHGYFEIDYDIVWDTATAWVPELITELEKILESS